MCHEGAGEGEERACGGRRSASSVVVNAVRQQISTLRSGLSAAGSNPATSPVATVAVCNWR